MLLNVSYNDPAIKRRIEEAVGAPFSLQATMENERDRFTKVEYNEQFYRHS
jgi:hypothetical protein